MNLLPSPVRRIVGCLENVKQNLIELSRGIDFVNDFLECSNLSIARYRVTEITSI